MVFILITDITDTHVVADDVVLEHVIEQLAPDDLNRLGTHLINNYTAIENLVNNVKPVGEPSQGEKAKTIVNYWIKTFPEATADSLMEAVGKLKNKTLTDELHKLLTKVKEEVAQEEESKEKAAKEKAAKEEVACDSMGPAVPETNPGEHVAMET